jgi:DNA-binding CsgD family transcriptional regulator
MNALINASNRSYSASKNASSLLTQTSLHSHLEEFSMPTEYQPNLLQGVLEAMMDGVLVLTDQGKLIYANQCAHQFFHWLVKDPSPSDSVPQPIWHICEALIESRALFPDRPIIIEDEIRTTDVHSIRIRVRWLEFDQVNRFHLLVTLEDRYQSIQNAAIDDARKYGLTERESEVWTLRCANLTYKAIALRLNIAVDTVKKHVKSIHAKRQTFLWEDQGSG